MRPDVVTTLRLVPSLKRHTCVLCLHPIYRGDMHATWVETFCGSGWRPRAHVICVQILVFDTVHRPLIWHKLDPYSAINADCDGYYHVGHEDWYELAVEAGFAEWVDCDDVSRYAHPTALNTWLLNMGAIPW